MQREMHHVKISTNEVGNTVIVQKWNDLNEIDTKIELTPDQVDMIAAWLLEVNVGQTIIKNQSSTILVNLWMNGPALESLELEIFQNQKGMVVFKISEEIIVEFSPSMAKRARDKLTKAIGYSFVDMLKDDSEV